MNKRLLKIASIVTYISGGIMLASRLLGLFFTNFGFIILTNVFTIPGILLSLLVLFAGYRLQEAEHNRITKNEVIVWGIVLVIVAYAVAGIITLIAAFTTDDFKITSFEKNDSLESKLKNLDILYNKGLITKEEYTERRKKIIDEI